MYLLCAPYSRRMACFKEITLLIPMDPYLHMAMRLHLARKKIPKASKMKFFFLEQSTITFLDQSFHLKCLVSNVVFKVPPIATEKKIAKLPNCPTTSHLNATTTYNYPNVTDSQWFYSIILLNHYIANLIILCWDKSSLFICFTFPFRGGLLWEHTRICHRIHNKLCIVYLLGKNGRNRKCLSHTWFHCRAHSLYVCKL